MDESTENGWQNGLTLKKTRDGYSWTIAIAARDGSIEAFKEVIDRVQELDAEMHRRFRK